PGEAGPRGAPITAITKTPPEFSRRGPLLKYDLLRGDGEHHAAHGDGGHVLHGDDLAEHLALGADGDAVLRADAAAGVGEVNHRAVGQGQQDLHVLEVPRHLAGVLLALTAAAAVAPDHLAVHSVVHLVGHGGEG